MASVLTGDRAKQPDFLMPCLSATFGCIGLSSQRFLPLQATVFRDDDELKQEQSALISLMDITMLRHKSDENCL